MKSRGLSNWKMSTTTSILVIAILAVGAALAAGESIGTGCRLAGTWLTVNPDTGSAFLDTLIPMDPAEQRLAYVSEWINQDPSFGGFFPATAVTTIRGEMVRDGRDFGHISILAYGTAEAGAGLPKEIVYATVLSGPFEVIDCNTIVYQAGTLSIYLPWQDPLGSDPPLLCLPYTALTAKRVDAMPQCEVSPGP